MQPKIPGENVLHMAIVNEDPAMTKFFLDNGADYHQRACGNFFTCEDQKGHRKDSLEHEWFDMPVYTNYEGWVTELYVNMIAITTIDRLCTYL